jgi:hypothetical protein
MSGEIDELCDKCGGPVGVRGWMVPTGETLRLTEDGVDLPVVRIHCHECGPQ